MIDILSESEDEKSNIKLRLINHRTTKINPKKIVLQTATISIITITTIIIVKMMIVEITQV